MKSLIVAIFLLFIPLPSHASDFSVSMLLSSSHFETDFECVGEKRKWNEQHNGVALTYKNFFIGRYENSIATCKEENDGKSSIIGYEFDIGSWKNLEFSTSIGIADGYLEKDGKVDERLGEYRPWLSANAKYKIFRIYILPVAVGFGLEFDL